MTIKYLSLFSGIGGFELGLENSEYDFENIGFSEVDKYAKSIYLRHFPEHKDYGDATKINTEDLPQFDLLVGGFPCQAFSVAGKRRGFDDCRGTLFFEIARILKDKRPRYFLLENVKGLLSHNKGETFQTILEVLSDLGYCVAWEVLNSKDFVPQNRERIFIKGYLGRECGGEILYQERYCKANNGGSSQLIKLNNKHQAQSVYDANGLSCTLSANGGGHGGKTGLYSVPNTNKVLPVTKEGNAFAVTTRNRQSKLSKKQDNYVIEIGDEKHNETKKVGNVYPNGHWSGAVYDTDYISPTVMGQRSDNVVKIEEKTDTVAKPVLTPSRIKKRQNGRRMKEDGEPSFTLTATDQHGVSDGFRIRRLTPVECERLQGFPDNWTKYGKDDELISDTQRYKCCGNAVTTAVVTYIINNMFANRYAYQDMVSQKTEN